MRLGDIARTTADSGTLRKIARREWRCDRCPANRRENANRRPRQDRYKDRRRGR